MVGMINTYKASRVANVSIYSPANENYARLIHHSEKNASPGKLSYFPEDLTISDAISEIDFGISGTNTIAVVKPVTTLNRVLSEL